MAYPHRDVATNGGSTVTVTNASTALVATNQSRLTLLLANVGSTTVYLQFQGTAGTAPTAVAASSFPLAAGASLTSNDFTGAVAGITSTGSADVRVVEL